MKLRTKIMCLAMWALAFISIYAAAESLFAQFVCDNPLGCQAKRFEDGKPIEVKFRYGDMVSTEAGWVVHTADGWTEI